MSKQHSEIAKSFDEIVLVFDFDQTITSKSFHSHNYMTIYDDELNKSNLQPFTTENCLIVNSKVEESFKNSAYDGEAVKNAFDKYFNKHPGCLRDTNLFLKKVSGYIKQGAKIAIASFNQYPDVVYAALEKIGFSQETINDMTIILGIPSEGEKVGKILHLEKIMELTGITSREDVILIDDSKNNINLAENAGYSTVLAQEFRNYLDDIPKAKEHCDWRRKVEKLLSNKTKSDSMDSDLNHQEGNSKILKKNPGDVNSLSQRFDNISLNNVPPQPISNELLTKPKSKVTNYNQSEYNINLDSCSDFSPFFGGENEAITNTQNPNFSEIFKDMPTMSVEESFKLNNTQKLGGNNIHSIHFEDFKNLLTNTKKVYSPPINSNVTNNNQSVSNINLASCSDFSCFFGNNSNETPPTNNNIRGFENSQQPRNSESISNFHNWNLSAQDTLLSGKDSEVDYN